MAVDLNIPLLVIIVTMKHGIDSNTSKENKII